MKSKERTKASGEVFPLMVSLLTDPLILEHLNTTFPEVRWSPSSLGLEAFTVLNGDKFKLTLETLQFKGKVGVNVGFAILDEDGAFNEKHVPNLSSSSTEIFGAVSNALLAEISKYEIDFIIAISDGSESRSRLYKRLQSRFSKTHGMSYNSFKLSDGQDVFISSKGGITLAEFADWLNSNNLSKGIE